MRKQRVESFFKREIARIINQELNDPRLGIITVTDVAMSNDLKNATIYVTVLGDAGDKLKALERAKGYIKKIVASRVSMKFMPNIAFEMDLSLQYGERIDHLLDEIKKTDRGQ